MRTARTANGIRSRRGIPRIVIISRTTVMTNAGTNKSSASRPISPDLTGSATARSPIRVASPPAASITIQANRMSIPTRTSVCAAPKKGSIRLRNIPRFLKISPSLAPAPTRTS